MTCEQIENQILDYLDRRLPAPEQTQVAAHLQECPACRELARQFQGLDAQLARALKSPTLSAGFNERLHSRVSQVAVMTAAERQQRKQELQLEYETQLARLSLLPQLPQRLVEVLGFSVMLGFACCLFWLVSPVANFAAVSAKLSPDNQQLLNMGIAAAVPLALGLLFANPRLKHYVQATFQPAGGGVTAVS